jgi:hypothetical protein
MTEYMIGKGPGAGVQHKKEGPILEDDRPADLDLILDRITPEKREAFLRSRAKLIDEGDAESFPPTGISGEILRSLLLQELCPDREFRRRKISNYFGDRLRKCNHQ